MRIDYEIETDNVIGALSRHELGKFAQDVFDAMNSRDQADFLKDNLSEADDEDIAEEYNKRQLAI